LYHGRRGNVKRVGNGDQAQNFKPSQSLVSQRKNDISFLLNGRLVVMMKEDMSVFDIEWDHDTELEFRLA